MRSFTDIRAHTTSRWDAFWYAIVWLLGSCQAFVIRYVIRDIVWRSQNGRVNSASTMSDGHLHNVVQMLQRDAAQDVPEYASLLQEYQKRQTAHYKKLGAP